MVAMIFAMDKNWLIGKDNKIPWHYKEDLVYYKETVKDYAVLMGDKSYYSLKGYYKNGPLPYKKTYVASLDNLELEDATLVSDLDAFFKNNKEDIFVVGGATIYNLCLKYADKLYITHIDKEFEGDTYIKKFDLNGMYKLISKRVSEINPELSFCVYERR